MESSSQLFNHIFRQVMVCSNQNELCFETFWLDKFYMKLDSNGNSNLLIKIQYMSKWLTMLFPNIWNGLTIPLIHIWNRSTVPLIDIWNGITVPFNDIWNRNTVPFNDSWKPFHSCECLHFESLEENSKLQWTIIWQYAFSYKSIFV